MPSIASENPQEPSQILLDGSRSLIFPPSNTTCQSPFTLHPPPLRPRTLPRPLSPHARTAPPALQVHRRPVQRAQAWPRHLLVLRRARPVRRQVLGRLRRRPPPWPRHLRVHRRQRLLRRLRPRAVRASPPFGTLEEGLATAPVCLLFCLPPLQLASSPACLHFKRATERRRLPDGDRRGRAKGGARERGFAEESDSEQGDTRFGQDSEWPGPGPHVRPPGRASVYRPDPQMILGRRRGPVLLEHH